MQKALKGKVLLIRGVRVGKSFSFAAKTSAPAGACFQA
jgi:hypothetical protein